MTDLTDFMIEDRQAYLDANSKGVQEADAVIQEEKDEVDAKVSTTARTVYNATDLGSVGPGEEQYDYESEYKGGNTYKEDEEGGISLHNKNFKPGAASVAGLDLATGKKFSDQFEDADGSIAKGREMLQKGQFNTKTGSTYDQTDGLFEIASGVMLEGGSFKDFQNEMKGPWNHDQIGMAWSAANSAEAVMGDIETHGRQYYDKMRENYNQFDGIVQTIPAEGYTEESLSLDKDWIDGSRKMGEFLFGAGSGEGKDDAEIAESMKFFISQTRNNLDMTMLWANRIVNENDPELARNWLALDAQYDAMDITAESVGRFAVGQMNITNLLTFGGGVLISTLGKFAMNAGVKNAIKAVAYGTAYDAAAEGAMAVGENVARQNIEITAGQRDEVSAVEATFAGVIGVGAGLVIGGGINVAANKTVRDFATDKAGKAVKFMGQNMQDMGMGPMPGGPAAQRGSVGTPVTGDEQVTASFKLQQLLAGVKDGSKVITVQEQIKAAVNKGLVTPQEVKWSGVEDYLDMVDVNEVKLSRYELLGVIENNTPKPKLVPVKDKQYMNYSLSARDSSMFENYDEASYIVSEPSLVRHMVRDFAEKGDTFEYRLSETDEWSPMSGEDAFKSLDYASSMTTPLDKAGETAFKSRMINANTGKVTNFEFIDDLHDYMWERYEAVGTDVSKNVKYDEHMLVLPARSKSFTRIMAHFPEEQINTLDLNDTMIGHSRIEAAELDGKPGKMVLEIQSDYHKEGQRLGYLDAEGNWVGTQPAAEQKGEDVYSIHELGAGEEGQQVKAELLKIANDNGIDPHAKNAMSQMWPLLPSNIRDMISHTIPDYQPFGKDWDAMGMRLEIMDSINRGDEFVAWPASGDQIAVIEQWHGSYAGEGIIKRATTKRTKAMEKMGLEVEKVDMPQYKGEGKEEFTAGHQGWDAGFEEIIESRGQILLEADDGGYVLIADPDGKILKHYAATDEVLPGAEILRKFTDDEEYQFRFDTVKDAVESTGLQDTVFNVIRLTDEVKARFRKEGMNMYGAAGLGMAGVAENVERKRDAQGRFTK